MRLDREDARGNRARVAGAARERGVELGRERADAVRRRVGTRAQGAPRRIREDPAELHPGRPCAAHARRQMSR